jgi:diguanylate cyclase (GGDEF)-like protein
MSVARHALLTVTDDPKVVETLKACVEPAIPVLAVGSAPEALSEVQSGEPGLVLLDHRMPGLGISEFCQKLKIDPRTSRLPVLILCASEQEALPWLGKGVNDFLTFPFQIEVARTRLQNYQDLGRCVEALRRFSLVDSMTGIANRRRFDEFLTLEWRRNLRNHTPLSLVLMEVDHFRTYQDHYGVPAGESALRQIAAAFMEATQRPGDLVAYYSKAGFACVLPETDNLGAVSVAERMRAELATLAIPHEKSTTADILTMSVGTATRIPSSDMEPEDLIAMTEGSLHEAKRAGRNRVMFTS